MNFTNGADGNDLNVLPSVGLHACRNVSTVLLMSPDAESVASRNTSTLIWAGFGPPYSGIAPLFACGVVHSALRVIEYSFGLKGNSTSFKPDTGFSWPPVDGCRNLIRAFVIVVAGIRPALRSWPRDP